MVMFKRKGLDFEDFFDTEKVVMDIASKNVVSCEQDSSISEAMELIFKGYRKIPVTNDGSFAGIVTLNDILNYCGAGDKYQEFLKRDKPMEAKVDLIMDKTVVGVNSRYNLKKVNEVFKDFGRGSYPVLNGEKIVGMISDWDLLKKVKWRVGVNVEDVMVKRPAHAKETYPLLDVAKIMVKGGYRRLPVTRWDILTGIVLPYDILSYMDNNQGIENLRKETNDISKVMKNDVITVERSDDVGKATTLMLKHKVGGLPVLEDGELVGIITENDIVQGML